MPIEELLQPQTQPSLLQAALTAPLPDRPGFGESMQLMFQTGTVIGQLGESVPAWISSFADDEPGFDAYDPKRYNNADYFARHPSMIEPFKSGAVADIKSSAHFAAFEDRQDRDYEMRQRLGSATGTMQFFAGLAAAAPELVVTGAAGKALGLAAPKYLTEGTHMARAGKLAVAGGAFNLTYDQAQRAINPTRNVEEGTQALWMFGTGAAFGAAIPLFVAGANKIGKANTTARVMRLQREAAEMQASPVYQDIMAAAKADAADTLERLKKETPPAASTFRVEGGKRYTPGEQPGDALDKFAEQIAAIDTKETPSGQVREQGADAVGEQPGGEAGAGGVGSVVAKPSVEGQAPPGAGAKEVAAPIRWEYRDGKMVQVDDNGAPVQAQLTAPITTEQSVPAMSAVIEPVAAGPAYKPIHGNNLKGWEGERGRAGRELTSYPDDPRILAAAAEAQFHTIRLGSQIYNDLRGATQDLNAAKKFLDERYGGAENYPEAVRAIQRAEGAQAMLRRGGGAPVQAAQPEELTNIDKQIQLTREAQEAQNTSDIPPDRDAYVAARAKDIAQERRAMGSSLGSDEGQEQFLKDMAGATGKDTPFDPESGALGYLNKTQPHDDHVYDNFKTPLRDMLYTKNDPVGASRVEFFRESVKAAFRKLRADGEEIPTDINWDNLENWYDLNINDAEKYAKQIYQSVLDRIKSKRLTDSAFAKDVIQDSSLKKLRGFFDPVIAAANEYDLYHPPKVDYDLELSILAKRREEIVQAMGAASPEISTGDPSLDAAGADPTRHFTILDTPDTRAQIDEIKALRPDAIFHEHPMQGYHDYVDSLTKLQPIDLGPVGNKLAAVMGLFSPGKSVAQTVSLRARQAARLIFDYSRPTEEAGVSPLTFKSEIPAEGIRDIFLGWHDDAARGLHDLYVKGEVEGGRTTFGSAVTAYMRATNDLKRNPGIEPEAPASVKAAAKVMADYRLKMGKELQDVGLLPEDMDLGAASSELMRRYLTDRISRNSPEFKAKLIEQQRVNRLRDFDTGEPIVPLERPIVEDVVDHPRKGRGENDRGLSREEREAIKKMGEPDQTVEGDVATPLDEIQEGAILDELGEGVYKRYLEEVEIWHDRRADSTIKTLLELENAHGVPGAFSQPSPTKGRLIRMDETRFLDYLDQDAFSILGNYHHKVAGRLAIRQAIKANLETWQEAVKKATGKDLVKSGYDPQLIIDTVKHDFQALITATGPEHANRPKLQDKFVAARDRTLFQLEGKLAELEGRQLFPDNPSAGVGWQLLKFADRQIGKIASMAFLGKAAIANMGDVTAGSFFRNLTGRQRATIIDALNVFTNAPTRDIETQYVAHMDMARTVRDAELADVTENQLHRPYGSGTVGKILTAADTATTYAYDKFATVTGIRRVTSNQSRVFAHMVQQEVIAVARKMAKARRLVDESGMSEAKAMKTVDLHPLDAERMNRLGVNGAVAQRLMAQLDKHGLDFEGRRVTSDHNGYIAPEMKQWAESDKDLFRRLNFAVNSEVQNLILRPKLGSYPVRDGSFQSHLIRYVNMFQAFTFAWGNQLLPLAARRPGYEVARYVGLTVAAGAIADAMYAQLTGKRSIAESIEGWQRKPYGMIYAAVNRSPLLGWLQRPIGALEMLQVGPAKLMGIELQSVYGRRDADFGEIVFGPAYSWMKNLTQGTVQSLRDPGYWDRRGARQLWNTLPFHNWWGVEGFNRLTEAMGYDTPIGPKPIPTRMAP